MIEERELIDFVTSQRWFASKTRDVMHSAVVDRATLREQEPRLELLLVETRFDTGTHETYQLLGGEAHELDALADPRQVRELVHLMRTNTKLPAGDGVVEFASVDPFSQFWNRECRPRSFAWPL